MKPVNTMLNGLMRNCRYSRIKTSHSSSTYPMYRALNYMKCESDKWPEELGCRREGAYYRVISDNTDRTVALFSHGGSSSALFSHMLNLPFFYLCRALCPDFTAITVLSLSDEKGTLTAPTIEHANDSRHIKTNGVSYSM